MTGMSKTTHDILFFRLKEPSAAHKESLRTFCRCFSGVRSRSIGLSLQVRNARTGVIVARVLLNHPDYKDILYTIHPEEGYVVTSRSRGYPGYPALISLHPAHRERQSQQQPKHERA